LKFKKQQMIIIVVILIVIILIGSVAVVMMSNNKGSNSNNNDNSDDGTNNGGDSSDNGDNTDGSNQLTGNWIDLSSNINAVATECGSLGYTDYSNVFFIDEDEGWVTSSCVAEIYHTTDGGESWEVQTTQFPCNAIWMLNENEGYAGGSEGRVYRTTDGGNRWNVHGSIGATLTDITFPPQPADTGYCCGFLSSVFTITSSGVEQMENTEWSSTNMAAISFPTESEGWLVGEQVMVHYQDGVWKADQTLPSMGLNCIYFIDNINGWAVGSKIIHTNNGWDWYTQTDPDTQERAMVDIFFIDENEGWIVGSPGLILHTTNGGTAWTMEADVQINNLLRGISAPASDCVYICGNKGTFLKYAGE